MKIVAIIQARCSSTRFPNKVFANISGKPLIWHVVNRLKFSKNVDSIVLATTVNPLDDALYDWAIQNNVTVFRGDEDDVLSRYHEAAKFAGADVIVRVTADDPFKEPLLIDDAVEELLKNDMDFVCNNNPPSYPEGLDVEVFTWNALQKAQLKSQNAFEREHVTQYFYRNPNIFKMSNLSNSDDKSYLRWTIDTQVDLDMTLNVYSHLFKNDSTIFHMDDILELIQQKPEIAEMNLGVYRSEMYKTK